MDDKLYPSDTMIDEAAQHLAGTVIETPLLRFAGVTAEIWLKPEMLQPLGSFKLRCAANAVAALEPSVDGIYTASVGNFAQGLAIAAARRGCRFEPISPIPPPK